MHRCHSCTNQLSFNNEATLLQGADTRAVRLHTWDPVVRCTEVQQESDSRLDHNLLRDVARIASDMPGRAQDAGVEDGGGQEQEGHA